MKPGDLFAHGKYTLLRKLRSSGMAEVWLARQHGTEGFAKDVVIKRILPHLAEDEKLVTMFLDEARIAANLNHPNVVQIFDLGNDGENYFIAMEYIRGHDLEQIGEQLRKRYVPFPVEYAVRIIADTCLGLAYAHDCTASDGSAMNVVHRDVSPQNVLVSHTGVVKLIDFGIAKARTSSSRTQVGHTKGKICYMSPEQMMARDLDRRSDIFSTGVVLYEMLCSQKPFDGDNLLACFHKLMKEGILPPRTLRADLPPLLERIILKSLSKDREDRYPTATAMRADMEAFLREEGISVGPEHVADFLKFLFSSPDSTQVALDVPRVRAANPPSAPSRSFQNPSHPEPSPIPRRSTEDRINAVPVRQPLPTANLVTPSPPSFASSPHAVSVLDPAVSSAPHHVTGPSWQRASSPHLPIPDVGFSNTGPEIGLGLEMDDEQNPYASRRQQRGSPLWMIALFLFVLLIGGLLAAHFMGWLPGATPPPPQPPPPPRLSTLPPPSTANPTQGLPGSPSQTLPSNPAAIPNPPAEPRPNPSLEPRPGEPRKAPPSEVSKNGKKGKQSKQGKQVKPPPRRAASSGCPANPRRFGEIQVDVAGNTGAYVMIGDSLDPTKVPMIAPKKVPYGPLELRFIWGSNKTKTVTICIRKKEHFHTQRLH